MRLDFSQEQLELSASVARLFESESSPAAIRALWGTDTGRSPMLWHGLSEIGITAIVVPAEFGGLGGDETDLCLVLEQVGRFCVPDAVLEGCLVAPTAIALAGSDELKRRWLPGIAAGEVRATIALAGTTHVPDVHVSDIVILEREGELALYERSELDVAPLVSMDLSRRLFEVQPKPGAGIALDAHALVDIRARQDFGSAAVLNGISAAMIELTAGYIAARKQFGRTIGSFQAVKHQLAQAESRNALARQAARSASYYVATADQRAADAATLARVCAIEAEFESNRVALQLHGGIGFTWEYDLQLWLKRGKALEQSHGSRREALTTAGRSGLHDRASNAV
jgi:alkylation response protein AidB-like acyl-CoA dehydrogenase